MQNLLKHCPRRHLENFPLRFQKQFPPHDDFDDDNDDDHHHDDGDDDDYDDDNVDDEDDEKSVYISLNSCIVARKNGRSRHPAAKNIFKTHTVCSLW